jgi:hypothetical protein
MCTMRKRLVWTGVVALAACLLLGRVVIAGGQEAQLPGPSAEMKPMKDYVGTWDAQVKFWMDPAKPPQESKGVSKRAMILGDRFFEEKYEGQAFGSAFQGLGITGYNTVRKKFSSLWLDSMSNNMMVMSGTYDAGKKTYTYTAEEVDVLSGKKVRIRSLLRQVSADEQMLEVYMTPEGGKEYKGMEIKYTRRKG